MSEQGNISKDIVARLEDLLLQATTERSHYYVASCCRDAIAEIKAMRAGVHALFREIEAEGFRILVNAPGDRVTRFVLERTEELQEIHNQAWKYRDLCK